MQFCVNASLMKMLSNVIPSQILLYKHNIFPLSLCEYGRTLMQNLYYLSSVDRRWKKELNLALGRVIFCSPYLTPGTAESVICSAAVESSEIYTRFNVEDFASGGSSLRTLRRLLEKGYMVFEIPRLHAKIVLISGRFVSIGSQNLTANGVRNREATTVSTITKDVARVEAFLDSWLSDRRPITLEMVIDLESLLPPIARKYREAQKLAREAESKIKLEIENRELARSQNVQQSVALLMKRRRLISSGRSLLRELLPDGNVPKTVAEQFLRESVWWNTHSSGRSVRAPRHANRMKGQNGDWHIAFGANSFLVGRAIERCAKTCESFLASVENGSSWSEKVLKEKLIMNVRGAVATNSGAEYSGFYPIEGQDMNFGATSIDVVDFVNYALRYLPQGLLQ